MSINNSSPDIIVKGSILQEREEEDYPDPNTLPPPTQEPRVKEEVTLSELVPGKYVSTTARVVYLGAIERQDALGTKMIFSEILEDSTFRVPFVSHRISYPLIRNCVYKFQSAYVHEFPSDRSLLLVITEYTKINPKYIEDFREFIWKLKIDSIKRPVRSLSLQGVITTVYGNSGLIKRCNKCKSILYEDACPSNCRTYTFMKIINYFSSLSTFFSRLSAVGVPDFTSLRMSDLIFSFDCTVILSSVKHSRISSSFQLSDFFSTRKGWLWHNLSKNRIVSSTGICRQKALR
jgi:hypothetical protein